jgi:hypothetical protein
LHWLKLENEEWPACSKNFPENSPLTLTGIELELTEDILKQIRPLMEGPVQHAGENLARIKWTVTALMLAHEPRQFIWERSQPLRHYPFMSYVIGLMYALGWVVCTGLYLYEHEIRERVGPMLSWIIKYILKTPLEIQLASGWNDEYMGRATLCSPFFIRALFSLRHLVFGRADWYHIIDGSLWSSVGYGMISAGVPRGLIAYYTHRFVLAVIDPRTVDFPVLKSRFESILYWVSSVFVILTVMYRAVLGWARAVDRS